MTVVPSEDSHQSEYIAPTDARRGSPITINNSTKVLSNWRLKRIHLWIFRLCGNRGRCTRSSSSSDGRTILQPSSQATRWQLDSPEAGSSGCPDMARMVGAFDQEGKDYAESIQDGRTSWRRQDCWSWPYHYYCM